MPSDDFDLNLLRVLEAVLDERSVTRAAERLHLSQPAVSHALARARRSLGDDLLVGRGGQLALTPRGRLLALEVPAIMARIRVQVMPDAVDRRRLARRFVIAVPDFFAGTVGAPLHRRLSEAAPESSLEIRRLTVETGPELVDRSIDAAIGVTGSWPEPLRSTFLTSIAWRPIVSADHPLANRQGSLEELCATPHVDVAGHFVTGAVDSNLAARGLIRKVRAVVSTIPAMKELLPGTDLIGFAPFVGVLQPQLAWVHLPEDIVASTYEVWWGHRGDDDPAAGWLRHELVDVVRALTAQ